MRRTEDEETGKVSLRSTTVRAKDVSVMGEKAATYEGHSALVAHETVTVPVSSLKRYKLGSAQTLAQQEKTFFLFISYHIILLHIFLLFQIHLVFLL
jgi:hypothetical protein